MKSKKKFWIILLVIVVAVLILNPIGLMVIGVFVGMVGIKFTEAKLQKPAIYQPVAARLATYCQSDQNLFPEILSFAWLPPEVSHLGHPWCEVRTNFASVEFGGGFYHFGGMHWNVMKLPQLRLQMFGNYRLHGKNRQRYL
jgi:hypothetical protein